MCIVKLSYLSKVDHHSIARADKGGIATANHSSLNSINGRNVGEGFVYIVNNLLPPSTSKIYSLHW